MGSTPSGCQVRDVFCVFIITISSNITSITTSNTTIIANTTMIMDIIIINIIIPISLNRCVCPLFLLHKDLLVCFWLGLFLFSAGFVSSLICTDVEVGSQVEICYVPPFSIINHPSTEWANWTSFVLVNPLLIANIFGFFWNKGTGYAIPVFQSEVCSHNLLERFARTLSWSVSTAKFLLVSDNFCWAVSSNNFSWSVVVNNFRECSTEIILLSV